jgi:hypothetical protein
MALSPLLGIAAKLEEKKLCANQVLKLLWFPLQQLWILSHASTMFLPVHKGKLLKLGSLSLAYKVACLGDGDGDSGDGEWHTLRGQSPSPRCWC